MEHKIKTKYTTRYTPHVARSGGFARLVDFGDAISSRTESASPKFTTGFALLFAVVISSIILAIALGVTNIAFREVKFSSSAQGANDAFFAADTGAECALYYDIKNNSFFGQQANLFINYNGETISIDSPYPDTRSFSIPNLGSSQQGCASVTIIQDTTVFPITTVIVSKGYNNATVSQGAPCVPSANAVERQLEVTY